MIASVRLWLTLTILAVALPAFAQSAIAPTSAPTDDVGVADDGAALIAKATPAADGTVTLLVPADNPLVEYTFSPTAGTLTSARMLDPRFTKEPFTAIANVPESVLSGGPIDLVTTWSAPFLPLRAEFTELSGAGEVRRIARSGTAGVVADGTLLHPKDEAGRTIDRPVIDGDTLRVSAPAAMKGDYRVTRVSADGSLAIEHSGVLKDATGLTYEVVRKGELLELFKADPTFVRVGDGVSAPITYIWPDPNTDTSGVFIERRFTTGTTAYELNLTVIVHNTGSSDVKQRIGIAVSGWQHPEASKGGMFEYPKFLYAASCYAGDSLERSEYPSLLGEEGSTLSFGGQTNWVGIDTRYFTSSVMPMNAPGGQCSVRAQEFGASGGAVTATWWSASSATLTGGAKGCVPSWLPVTDGRMTCAAATAVFGKTPTDPRGAINKVYQVKKVGASGADAVALDRAWAAILGQERAVYRFRVFNGPKDIELLRAASHYTPPGGTDQDAKLEQSLDFGFFGIIGEFLHNVMRWFYGVVGSWALAIILLTVSIKLLLLPLTNKSFQSMQKMQQLKPKMEALKARLGDNKEEVQRETMALYKREGVNPLGGCLPMFVQMPIWIALYQTIYSAAELYHTPLGLWIQDLSSPDPYFVMPVVLGLLMVAQSFFTPTAGAMDGMQAKIMRFGMPVMFSFMMLFLPSGLVLYILVNTALTLVQNLVIRRRMA